MSNSDAYPASGKIKWWPTDVFAQYVRHTIKPFGPDGNCMNRRFTGLKDDQTGVSRYDD